GTWDPAGDPADGIRRGKLDFQLHGDHLRGGWKLVRTQLKGGDKPQWLLLKRDDEARDAEADDLMPETLQRSTRADERKRTARKQAAARKKASKVAPARARKRTGKASSAKTWSRRASALEGATSLRDDEPIGPQLALAKPSPPAGEKWLHEVKWDGYR